MKNKVYITETPRDGLQGLKNFIPTKVKIELINNLLRCGFDTLEIGSFVSPKAIPQMRDTEEILRNLDTDKGNTKIAVLVVNETGGKKACDFERIDKIFYPFSLSETFLKKNINKTIIQAENTIDKLVELSNKHGKETVIYYSWGFGNPYGDVWNIDILAESVYKMTRKGLKYFPLSDIDGEATPKIIKEVFDFLTKEFPHADFGFHLHSLPEGSIPKIEAAYDSGIRHFDSVTGGLGGCPMTGKELVSNVNTLTLIDYFETNNISTGIKKVCLHKAVSTLSGIL